MSWTSRLGNLGRFSPFSRSPPQGPTKVSDADFSYITADDLRRHQVGGGADSPTDLGSPRDTDMLILRNKKKEYPVHFPAYSIAKGEVTIGLVREHAAKKLGTADLRRVKLLYKGKNLKDDQRLCKQEGLRDGAEVMCAIADNAASSSDSEDEDDDISDFDGGDQDGNGDGRRKRNRGKKSKRRIKREQQQQQQQAPDAPRPANLPATPLDKLNAIANTLRGFEVEAEKLQTHPPADTAKREFEYKRLSESILAMVLLKLDGVETEGDQDARLRRKELVKDAQAVLHRLDESAKS